MFNEIIKQKGKKTMAGIRILWEKATKYGAKLRPELYFRTRYIWYREHCPVQAKLILLESLDGAMPTDNIAAILKELCSNVAYQEFQICLSGKKETVSSRRKYLQRRGLNRVKVLSFGTREYFKVLATAKFLVTEVSFHFSFIKRPEQVYLNTWHGTPLKTLGRQVKSDFAMIGNVQRNFLDADYLLCPNEFTKEVLVRDYMLSNLAKTTLLMTGYPRNEMLLDKKRWEEVRIAEGLVDKQMIAFLPTWRGTMEIVEGSSQRKKLQEMLRELDGLLSKNQVCFVKLHPMTMMGMDFSGYQKIKAFPEEYDTYDFLSAMDVLVTDYSSVFFDFAVTGRKIILFPYDKEEYETDRGFYFKLEELPFPQVYSVKELAEEIKRPKEYEDNVFLEKFCPYDRKGVTAALCSRVFLESTGEHSSGIRGGVEFSGSRTEAEKNMDRLLREQSVPDNGKPNIVLFIGGFEKNGITTAAVNLLQQADREKYNFYVIYRMNDVKGNQEVIKVLPDGVSYLGFYRAESMTLAEFVPYAAWKLFRKPSFKYVQPILERYGVRERQRLFGNCRVDQVIQYIGYVPEMIMTMASMPCHRTIFVHSDMERESDVLKKIDKALLRYAYKTYDTVAAVTEGMVPSTKRIYGEADVKVCRNVIDTGRILNLAEKELIFDTMTVYNMPEQQIRERIASPKKKLIAIGRFSPEKGHERLIRAFGRLHRDYPDTCLFIVGGYGDLYQKTVEWAAQTGCADDIVIIRYMSNPYPLLKQCDCLVLSSFYEGFGLVLAEADILGIPCFSTDLEGPGAFMREHGGMLVENSEEGIYHGLLEWRSGGTLTRLNVDYEEYNQRAVEQFEALLVTGSAYFPFGHTP